MRIFELYKKMKEDLNDFLSMEKISKKNIGILSRFEKSLVDLELKKKEIYDEYNSRLDVIDSMILDNELSFEKSEESYLKDNLRFIKERKLNILKSLNSDIIEYNSVKEKIEKEYESAKDHIFKSHKFEYQNRMSDSLNRSRDSMPQISDKDIDSFLIHFAGNSNNAKVTKTKVKLSDLKPTQNEINDSKVVSGLTNNNWSERNYIISKDNYLLDGHHSWASGLEVDKDKEVQAYKINLPIKELLRRTNLMKISGKRDINDNNIVKSIFEGVITSDEEMKDYLSDKVVISNTLYEILEKGEPIIPEMILSGSVSDVVLNKNNFEKSFLFITKDNEDHGFVIYKALSVAQSAILVKEEVKMVQGEQKEKDKDNDDEEETEE